MEIEVYQITIEIGLLAIEMEVIENDAGLIISENTNLIIDVMLISIDVKLAIFNVL